MDNNSRKSPRLLIVDDNENIHEDLKYILNQVPISETEHELQSLRSELFGDNISHLNVELQMYHYRIDDAWQGAEAISVVMNAITENDPYSIVFLDVNMPPGIDGIQTIGRLWEVDPHLEVVICTAYSNYTWDQIVALYGQTDQLLFVRKPFDSMSIKQIALSLSTKWYLARQNRQHIENLEFQVYKRTNELEKTILQLKSEISLRHAKEMQLVHLAHYDTLTGLLNWHSFYEFIGGMITSAPTETQFPTHALLYVDIDGFKQINDQWGHDMGDHVLVEISSRIKQSAGSSPHLINEITSLMTVSKPETAIFRLGGDEFTLLLDYRNREEVSLCAEQIVSSLSDTFHLKNQDIHITCSIGISLLYGDATDFSTLLKHADISMYKAKEQGSSFVFYDELHKSNKLNPSTLLSDTGK